MYGIGGGIIWDYNFGNKSELRLSGLYGYGATDFQGNIGNQISAVNNAWSNQFNRFANGLSNNVSTLKWEAIRRGEPGQPQYGGVSYRHVYLESEPMLLNGYLGKLGVQ